ncbi:endonuclease VII domain-containing protein [Streptomyces sp. NPDC056508]|uniref:endonuclease VII domain-containing protein n=1 Tax=Streptomyces sp. NPDC056508 TaxID=3345845 RepID=UPI0036ADADC3
MFVCAITECESAALVGPCCPGHALANYFRTTARVKPVRQPTVERCSFDECSGAAVDNGLCSPHGAQRQNLRPLTAIRPRRAAGATRVRDAEGRKECGSCRQWLPEDRYRAHSVMPDGLRSMCKACQAHTSRLRKYRLTPGAYTAMLDAQGGVCAICKTVGETKNDFAVDHDRACCPRDRSCGKCVRGLLCGRCNSGLGFFKDSAEALSAAITYLAQPR